MCVGVGFIKTSKKCFPPFPRLAAAASLNINLISSIAYSTNPDIPTIHLRDGKYFLVSHRESYPGGMDMVEVEADKATGELVALNTTNVDFAAYNGLWFPCSGSIFPYGDTHLGSEEFEPDCRYTLSTNFGDSSRSSPFYGATAQV